MVSTIAGTARSDPIYFVVVVFVSVVIASLNAPIDGGVVVAAPNVAVVANV